MRLHLGVLDIPYTDSKESKSTGDIAEILEEKYSVMGKFFEMHQKEIVADIEDSIAGAIENSFGGAKGSNIFAEAMGKTEKRFKNYLDKEEHGISLKKHTAPKAGGRKKRQYKKVEHTTAFIYSGLYRMSFKAWIEE